MEMLDKKTFKSNINTALNKTVYAVHGEVLLFHPWYAVLIGKYDHNLNHIDIVSEDIDRLKELLAPASAEFFACTFKDQCMYDGTYAIFTSMVNVI